MNNEIVRLRQADIYQNDHRVLTDVSLNLTRGEFAYLIGKTGSGKTSLLKTLYGALPLKSGSGRVAGFRLEGLSRREIPKLRRKLGIVFQDFNLLTDRSVGENLRFVLRATNWRDRSKIQSRISGVLSEVDLAGRERKMPHQLSGGEQQRVVIARALLNEPELIIADEPTGNLDPETSEDILQLMRQLALKKNTAILLATHDYRILENFPARIIRCIDQRVVDDEDIRMYDRGI
ncbi:MAG: ATP-binding cassette domain-containing protein [Saprospiraceae bacterium]|nr:ATP-binding cassette domain-containing protein [Saprospiraceae bacterium]